MFHQRRFHVSFSFSSLHGACPPVSLNDLLATLVGVRLVHSVGVLDEERPPRSAEGNGRRVPERVRIENTVEGREIENLKTHSEQSEDHEDGRRPARLRRAASGAAVAATVAAASTAQRARGGVWARRVRYGEPRGAGDERDAPRDPQEVAQHPEGGGKRDVVAVREMVEGRDVDEVAHDDEGEHSADGIQERRGSAGSLEAEDADDGVQHRDGNGDRRREVVEALRPPKVWSVSTAPDFAR